VIGTVGSMKKAEIAKAHGCDHAIVYTRDNFTKKVREITNAPRTGGVRLDRQGYVYRVARLPPPLACS